MGSSDVAAIQNSLSHLGLDEQGCFISTPLFDLGVNFLVNSKSEHREISRAIRNLQHDLWQVSALTSRLTWMREMLVDGQLHEASWRSYCHLDIEQFYVQLRSALDYLAIVISESAPKKGQLPKSFTGLRNYARKHPNRLEAEIRAIICGADWFDDLRSIRDSLVHEGAEPVVFSGKDDWLLFQVHGESLKNLVTTPFMLYNENVAYFQRFAAWSFAHTLLAVNLVGTHISGKYTNAIAVGPAKSYDFSILRLWLNDLLAHLKGLT